MSWSSPFPLGGHGKAISSLEFSRCGNYLASASADTTITIWDVAQQVHSPRESFTFPETSASTAASSFSALSSSSVEFETSADNNKNNLEHNINKNNVNIGSNSSTSCRTNSSSNGSSRGSSNNKVSLYGHERGINDMSWSVNSSYLATASDDCSIRLWDLEKGKGIRSFTGHSKYVFCCQFNPQNSMIASGSFDETMKLWDVRTRKNIHSILAHSEAITSIDIEPVNGYHIVTSSYDGLVRLWDTRTGCCFKTLFATNTPPVGHIQYSPNGKYLLVSTLDNIVRLWDIDYTNIQRLQYYTHLQQPQQPQQHGQYGYGKNQFYCVENENVEKQNKTIMMMTTRKKESTPISEFLSTSTSTSKSLTANPVATSVTSIASSSLSKTLHEQIRPRHLPIPRLPYPPENIVNCQSKCVKRFEGHTNKKYCIFSRFVYDLERALHVDKDCISNNFNGNASVVSGSEDENNCIFVWNVDDQKNISNTSENHERPEEKQQEQQISQQQQQKEEQEKPGYVKLMGHRDRVIAVATHPLYPLIASGGIDKDRSIQLWRRTG